MSKNAPDTRNKLEKIKAPTKKIAVKKRTTSRVTLGDLRPKNTEFVLKASKKKSKGQLFKEAKGISKTMKRLLHKYGESLTEYKERRKTRKLGEKRARQEKHHIKSSYKRIHSKDKGAKGKTQAPKKAA